nr:pyridoxamine 5'-phosphate oxidase family protein [Nocardioides perillae]
MDARTCRDLLDLESVGRAAFVVDGRPQVQLVAYVRVGDRLEVAAGAGSALAHVDDDAVVAVQVDRVDRDRGDGWSVVATGPARPGRHLADGSCTVVVALAGPGCEVTGRWVGAAALTGPAALAAR